METIDNFTPKTIQATAFVSTNSTAFGFKLADGKPRISDTPYEVDVAEGNITNHSAFFRIGYVSAMANTSADMWALGATVPTVPFPASSGAGFAVVSASTLDSSAGTGIRTVTVDYLDLNWAEQTTTVTLSTAAGGSTAGATDAIRINSIRANTAGTLGKAAGAVSVCATSASTQIYRQISAGETRGRTAMFTVPSGKTLYLTDINGGVGAGAAGSWARLKLMANQNASGTTQTFYLPFWENIIQFNSGQHVGIPIKISERVDVKMVGVTNQSSGMSVECVMRGWLETN